MEFEYDEVKSQSNLSKHGISFEEGKQLWSIPSIELQAKTVDEPRFIIIGKIKNKCYSCIFTYRGEAIRIISIRRSRKEEEELYYEHI